MNFRTANFPTESHGQRSLAGYSPWGHKRVGHDLVTRQQQNILLLNISSTTESFEYSHMSSFIAV